MVLNYFLFHVFKLSCIVKFIKSKIFYSRTYKYIIDIMSYINNIIDNL